MREFWELASYIVTALGLPVAIALLPPQALAISITVDLVGTLVTWQMQRLNR